MKKSWMKELRIEKICLLMISVFVFVTMYYYDNQTAFVCIQRNMHKIAEGKWYYLFNGWFAIPYGNLFQMFCGIWALPVFILSELGIVSTTSIGVRLWYKLFVFIFLLLDAWQVGEIAEKCGFESKKKEWIKIFFLSSLLVLLPAVHIAQFDAIYLFFILAGISSYLDDKYFRFLLCFMFAIPGKYMPLFVFIPLVLLKEKRYLYIIRDLAIGCVLVLVDKVMNSIGYRLESYLGIDPYAEILTNNTMQQNFEGLLHSDFKAFDSNMSFMVLGFALLCIWCFMQDSKKRKELSCYVAFISFSVLFSVGFTTPYWIILLMPFMLLLTMKNEKYYSILMPLELIFTGGYIFIYIIKMPWIFGSADTFDFLLLSLIPGYQDMIHACLADFLKFRGLLIFDGAVAAMMVACLLGIGIIANPCKQKQVESTAGNNVLRCWYWGRIACVVAWILLNIWVVLLNHVW